MANRIKGITIEIEGNTTKLQTALSGVNKDLKTTQSNLRDVKSLLKLEMGKFIKMLPGERVARNL